MALSLDDYIHCSPYLSVASLDRLLDQPGEDGLAFDIPDPQPSADVVFDRQRTHDIIHGAVDKLTARQRAVISAKRVGEHTGVEVGLSLCQRLKHPGQHVHAGARDDPGDERAQRPGGIGKGARQREDARADHAADHHGGERLLGHFLFSHAVSLSGWVCRKT